MNNFNIEKYLNPTEQILYQCEPKVGKTSKINLPILAALIFVMFIQFILIVSYQSDHDLSIIFILLISLVIGGYLFYELIYRLFFRDKKIIYYQYYLTTERVIRYDKKKNKIVSNNVLNYDTVFVSQCKNGYGDLIFTFDSDKDIDVDEVELANSEFKLLKKGRPMVFESIEHPYEVLKIVKNNFYKFS